MLLHGVGVSSGIGVGKIVLLSEENLDYSTVSFSGKDSEKQRLQQWVQVGYL